MNYISHLQTGQGVLTHHRMILTIDSSPQEILLISKQQAIEVYLTTNQKQKNSSPNLDKYCELYAQVDLLKPIRDIQPIATGHKNTDPLLLILFKDGEYLIGKLDMSSAPVLRIDVLMKQQVALEKQALDVDSPLLHVQQYYPSSPLPCDNSSNCGYMIILGKRLMMVEWQIKTRQDLSFGVSFSHCYPSSLYPHKIQHLVALHTEAMAQKGSFGYYPFIAYIMMDDHQYSSKYNQSLHIINLKPIYSLLNIDTNNNIDKYQLHFQVKVYGAIFMSDSSFMVFTKNGIIIFNKNDEKPSHTINLILKLSCFCRVDNYNDLLIIGTKNNNNLFLLSYKSEESLGIQNMNSNSEVLQYKYLGSIQESHKLTYLNKNRLMTSNPQENSYLIRLSETILSRKQQCLDIETEFRQLGNVLDLRHQHLNINSVIMTLNQHNLLNTLQKGSHLDSLSSLTLSNTQKPTSLSVLHKRFLIIIANTYLFIYHLQLSSFLFLQMLNAQQKIVALYELNKKYQFVIVYNKSVCVYGFDSNLFLLKFQIDVQQGMTIINSQITLIGENHFLILVNSNNQIMKYIINETDILLQQTITLNQQISQIGVHDQQLLIAYWNDNQIQINSIPELEHSFGQIMINKEQLSLTTHDNICSMIVDTNHVIVGTSTGLIVSVKYRIDNNNQCIKEEEKVVIGGSMPIKLIQLKKSNKIVSVSNRTMTLSYNHDLNHYDQNYIGQDNIQYVQEIAIQDTLFYLFLLVDSHSSTLILGTFQKNYKYISVPFLFDNQNIEHQQIQTEQQYEQQQKQEQKHKQQKMIQDLLQEYEGEQMSLLSENLLAISMNSTCQPIKSRVIVIDLRTQQIINDLQFPLSISTHMSFHSPLLFLALEKHSQNSDPQHPQQNIVSELILYQLCEEEGLQQLTRNCYMDRVMSVRPLMDKLYVIGLSEQLLVVQVQVASHHNRNILQQVCDKPLTSQLVALEVQANLIMVADYFKNVLLYYYQNNIIYPLAYTQPINDKLIEAQFYTNSLQKRTIASYLSGDVVIYDQKQKIENDNDILKLEVQCAFKSPEVITRMIKIQGINGDSSIIYGTLNGSTGFICELNEQQYKLLFSVQNQLISHYKQINYPTIQFDHSLNENGNIIIMGDFIKTIKDLNQKDLQKILGDKCTLSQLLLLLDSLEKNVFQ